MQGRIIKNISNTYTVLVEDKTLECKQRGKLKHKKEKPVVGDIVTIDSDGLISSIEKRKNELSRPVISNIDTAYIVTSLKKPSLDLFLLDRLLVIINYNNIKPIICFTKYDLLNKEEQKEISKIKAYYESIGIDVYMNFEEDKIKQSLSGKISVLTGQTGAGKSSLLNRLDPSLDLKTREISNALNRGKNTTTHVELLPISDGWIADTPGFSDIDICLSKEEVRDNIIEFEEYKEFCKYRDCMHDKELDCHVKEKVKENVILKSRYENYIKMIRR